MRAADKLVSLKIPGFCFSEPQRGGSKIAGQGRHAAALGNTPSPSISLFCFGRAGLAGAAKAK